MPCPGYIESAPLPAAGKTANRRTDNMNACKPSLLTSLSLFASLSAACAAAQVDFLSPYYALGLSRTNPAIACLSVDSLCLGKLTQNPVCVESLPAQPWQIQRLSPNR